jgi:ABC-2 type transport system permease protein
MSAASLLRLLARRHGAFVLACGALLALFQVLIGAAIGAVDVEGALGAVLRSLPLLVRDVLAEQMFGGLTERGLQAFGWSHPIAQALGAAVAVRLGARAVAGECENGMMETLLAAPLSRGGYLAAQVGFALSALALVAAAGVAGSALAQAAFGLVPVGAATFARLGADYAALQADWFALTLALSAGAREGGRAASAGFLLALVSYLVSVVGRLWDPMAPLLPWSLFTRFEPRRLLLDQAVPVRDEAVLLAVLAAGVAWAAWRFRRRDLP